MKIPSARLVAFSIFVFECGSKAVTVYARFSLITAALRRRRRRRRRLEKPRKRREAREGNKKRGEPEKRREKRGNTAREARATYNRVRSPRRQWLLLLLGLSRTHMEHMRVERGGGRGRDTWKLADTYRHGECTGVWVHAKARGTTLCKR